jgi:hypothetical protein
VAVASSTDALERPLESLGVGAGGTIELDLRPFELVTVKLSR